ncbi:MAG: PilZ domain-containing protein [Pseudomonadota bacterium]
MSEDRGTDETVDQGAEQRRYPRAAGAHRLFLIHDGERFQAETVDLSKSGMLAACQVIPPSLKKGASALFELVWSPEPEANAFIKGNIIRVIRDSDFDNVLLGVEFTEALARGPAALRGFLDQVLGIEHGAIRVVKDRNGHKSLVFDFDPVHREGEERLRALQSSLFHSVHDLDEADRLLEGFGTGETLFSPEQSSPIPAASEKLTSLDEAPTVRTTAPDMEPKKGKPGKRGKEKPIPIPGTRPSLLKSLIPSFGRGERGGELIGPEQARASVANISGIDIEFDIDGKKRKGRAVRLYCAGIKCEVLDGLPELYRSVTILIPNLGGRKGSVILYGDITRVRPNPGSDEAGIFEVRLSLRNETVMLNNYRQMVEQLSIGES